MITVRLLPEKVLEELKQRKNRNYYLLYFYGNAEKTEEIATKVSETFTWEMPTTAIVHTTGEAFCKDVISRCAEGTLSAVGQEYQGDLLLLENVQDVAGKETVEQMLYGILDWFLENGKQIVATGNAPLCDIPDLAPRICAQLSGGISVCAR